MELTEEAMATMFATVMPHLDERQRRVVAGSMARALGRGGIAAVARTAPMSRSTVQTAVGEIDAGMEVSARVRKPGGGRKQAVEKDPELLGLLDELVDPDSRGDPMSPLRWTCKSTYQLADALSEMGHPVSSATVAILLRWLGYSLQATSKEREGTQHPDRDAQFHHLNDQAREHLAAGQPVISVDTKKSA